MRTLQLEIDGSEVAIHHNGDWSGDVVVSGLEDQPSIVLPGALFVAVAEHWIDRAIAAAIDDGTFAELIRKAVKNVG